MNNLINISFKESDTNTRNELGFWFSENQCFFYYPKQINYLFDNNDYIDKIKNMKMLLDFLKAYNVDGLNKKQKESDNEIEKFLALLALISEQDENGKFFVFNKRKNSQGSINWKKVFERTPIIIDNSIYFEIQDYSNPTYDNENMFFKLYQYTINNARILFGLDNTNDIDINDIEDKHSIIINFLNENFRDRDQHIGTLLKTIYIDKFGNEYKDKNDQFKDISYITNFHNFFQKLVNDFLYQEIADNSNIVHIDNDDGEAQPHIVYSKHKTVGYKKKINNNSLNIDGFFRYNNKTHSKREENCLKTILNKIIEEWNNSEYKGIDKENFFFILDSKFMDNVNGSNVPKQFIYYSLFSTISRVLNDSNKFFNLFFKPSDESSREKRVLAKLSTENNNELNKIWQLYPAIGDSKINEKQQEDIVKELEKIFGNIYEIEISVKDLINWKLDKI